MKNSRTWFLQCWMPSNEQVGRKLKLTHQGTALNKLDEVGCLQLHCASGATYTWYAREACRRTRRGRSRQGGRGRRSSWRRSTWRRHAGDRRPDGPWRSTASSSRRSTPPPASQPTHLGPPPPHQRPSVPGSTARIDDTAHAPSVSTAPRRLRRSFTPVAAQCGTVRCLTVPYGAVTQRTTVQSRCERTFSGHKARCLGIFFNMYTLNKL